MTLAYGSTTSDEDEVNDDGNGEGPVITIQDDDLAVELVSKGLDNPTNMAFLNEDDILVFEKDNGTGKEN